NMQVVDPTTVSPCCDTMPDYEMNGYPTAGAFDGSGVGGSVSGPAPVSTSTVSAGKNLGATPGGAQDIGLVRRWIEDGLVPTGNNLTVEGLLSEHDLPIEGQTCEQFLCVHGALGMSPTLDDDDGTTFVQIGFMSGLRTDTFKRRPLNLVVVVDVSGSMGSGDKMVATREALNHLVDQLGEDDRFGIVKFNSEASVVLESTPATDKAALKAAIAQLNAGGSTNIEAGLVMGYEMAAKFLEESGRNHRVMLFTDAQPNVGNTEQGGFIAIAKKYADLGIGLSSFGVGIDFQHELILGISQIRGGNYFYLENADKIRKVFDEDFDYLVTPLAYDMKVSLTPGANYEIVDVYGIPNWSKGEQTITLDVKTVFLSRNKGAIMLRLKYVGPLYL
ncbi:MAG: VWA domain-containing protein, partial [Myxococcales bacterium]|nr:VWA domain-containing protein [Myxococcales bacterium]